MVHYTNGEPSKSSRWESIFQVMSDYKYRTLPSTNHTRLFYLYPKSKGAEIGGKLIEVEFEQLRHLDMFSALSYHWGGDDSPQRWITIYQPDFAKAAQQIDPMKGKRYRVKENLFFALEALRDPFKPVLLWIDALCINQNNPVEKQNQLAKINLAYELAPDVTIWLGPEDKETGQRKKAIEFVELIAAEETSRKVKGMASNPHYIDHWLSLSRLVQLSWFSRKWVIQEVALAKNAQVRCGSLSVPWHDLQVAIHLMERYSEQIRELTKDSKLHDHNYHEIGDLDTLEAKVLVDTVHNMFRRDIDGAAVEPNLGLEYLVSALSCFQSADPRDTINALRNISRETRAPTAVDDEKAPPKATYTLDKTLAEIYVDFFRWVYETTGSIDIICRKWAIPEKTKRTSHIVNLLEGTKVDTYPELSKIPSYIQTIGMPTQSMQASGDASIPARTEGISLVGLPAPGKAPYNASYYMSAQVHFETTRRSTHTTDTETAAQTENNPRAGTTTMHSEQYESSPRPAVPGIHGTNRSENGHEEKAKPTAAATPSLMLDGIDLSDVVRVGGSKPVRKMVSSTSLNGKDSDEGLPLHSIRVRGVPIGIISWHTSPMQQGVIHNDVLTALGRDLGKNSNQTRPTAPTGLSDKLWRGLVAERGANGDNPPPTYPSACRYIMKKHRSPDGSLNIRTLLQSSHLVDFEKDYLNRVYAVTYNRSFFEASQTSNVNEGDQMPPLHGFGAAGSKAGDIVCILFGCSVPVILRRGSSPAHEECYTLVGECYVYGQMDGEAIRSMDARRRLTGKDPTRDFILF